MGEVGTTTEGDLFPDIPESTVKVENGRIDFEFIERLNQNIKPGWTEWSAYLNSKGKVVYFRSKIK